MKSRKMTVTLFILYLLLLSWVILMKMEFSFAFLNTGRSINLVPFGGMLILNGRLSYNEILYNGVLFVPLGIFVCMLARKKSLLRLIVPIILLSLFFEMVQYIFAIGASDITDVIANTLGGMAGIGVYYLLQKVCKENLQKAVNILLLVLAIGFFLFVGMIKLTLKIELGNHHRTASDAVISVAVQSLFETRCISIRYQLAPENLL